MKYLLTGGSGLLGTELQKHLDCDALTHLQMDITKPVSMDKKHYDAVIHAAAYTDVDRAEAESNQVFDVNLGGTLNMLYEFGLTPFVYISTEYARNPVNMYSASKYAGEVAVKILAEKYLIIRTLFKPSPWPWDNAFADSWTNGDYVEVIAPLIAQEIEKWNWNRESKLVYVGTGRKTMFELAIKTKPDVKPAYLKDWQGVKRQFDYQ